MSPEERDDELFQEYLEGDSALSRLYRQGGDEQPGAHLDARIRARAHDAVAPDKRVAHSPFAHNWMVPTSLAAVLMLSVSVVVLMPEPVEVPGPAGDRSANGSPETVMSRELPDKAADTEQQPAAESAVAPAQAAKRRKQSSDDGTGDDGTGAAGGRAAEFARDARQPAKADDEAPGEERKEAAPRVQSPSIDDAQSSPWAPAALESASQAAPPPGPMPASAVRDDPRAWLRFIESLLDEQKLEGAKANLRAFRGRYPDYPLPASLVPLAASLGME